MNPLDSPQDLATEPPWSALQQALQARRRTTLAHVDSIPSSTQLSACLFELFEHLATTPGALLEREFFDQVAEQHGFEGARLALHLRGEKHLLFEALSNSRRSAEVSACVGALFACGFAGRLAALENLARRAFTLEVVAMLPAVERLGPFVLTDFIDEVCDEDDALRFWQIYVDRVTSEVNRRTHTAGRNEPWLLSRLLRLEKQGPAPGRGGAWMMLKRHVDRVLLTRRHRWRFVRSLAEGCEDPRMLHYLCTSPAMLEDPEVVRVFLTQGNARLVSCALFALQAQGGQEAGITAALAFFEGRPLSEVGERMVELYAQLKLLNHPQPGLVRLTDGLLQRAQLRLQHDSVDPLVQAVSRDARALRQVVLLADLVPGHRPIQSEQERQLLDRVLQTFLQMFTPEGIDHFLNDGTFRGAAEHALVCLLGSHVAEAAERVASFGLSLDEVVDARWGEDELQARRLLGRFLGIYGRTLVGACRTLYARTATRDAGLMAYETLVRIYMTHPVSADGTGWFGVLEQLAPVLFADAWHEGLGDLSKVEEIAAVVAEAEHGLWSGSTRLPTDEGGVPEAPALLKYRPSRESPVSAPVQVVRGVPTRVGGALRAYLGLSLLGAGWAGLMRAFGFKRAAELTITDRELVLHERETVLDEPVDAKGLSFTLDELVGVEVEQLPSGFYLVLGALGLLTAGLLGGHLVFSGLRGAEPALTGLGVGALVVGVIFDAVMGRTGRRNRRSVWLTVRLRGRADALCMRVDTDEGARLLDALMATDAERREVELVDRWSDDLSLGWGEDFD